MADTTKSTWPIHAYYLGIILVALLFGYSWVKEHDARLVADQAVKTAQVQVQSLQQQIADRDKQVQQQVAPIVKIIHDTTTVPQAIKQIPNIVVQPLKAPVVSAPNNAVLIPEPDVIPVFDQLADDKICRPLLAATQQDLVDEKNIEKQKDDQIVALKKKPGFLHRVGEVAKQVGIGIGIGVLVAKYI